MRGFFGLAVAAATALIGQTLADTTFARPGGIEDLIITEANTLNDTRPGLSVEPTMRIMATSGLKVAVHNNLGSATANAFITAHDPNGAVVILKADGTWYRPQPNGSKQPVLIPSSANIKIPIGKNGVTEVTLPTTCTSGRVYVAEGELKFYTLLDGNNVVQLVEPSFANLQDPNAGMKWGFVEFSQTPDGSLWANLSFVDFIGTLFSIGITLGDGSTQQVQGLKSGAMDQICSGLVAQTAIDGQPWDQMCVTDSNRKPLRILSPNIFVDSNKGQQASYYKSYIDQVWAKYANQDLILRTAGYGDVACRTSGNNMNCKGDSSPFPKPAIQDIWGCNTGTFARVDGNAIHETLRPVLCAAFTRTTLLLSGGNIQPSLPESSYYKNSPTNHYARLVHQYEVGGRGYAFSFDDVNPSSGPDQSGTLSGPNAKRFDIYVGGATTTSKKARSFSA